MLAICLDTTDAGSQMNNDSRVSILESALDLLSASQVVIFGSGYKNSGAAPLTQLLYHVRA